MDSRRGYQSALNNFITFRKRNFMFIDDIFENNKKWIQNKLLKVKHIIVCGHSACGGVKAAMQPVDLGILNPWLRNIRDVYRLHKDELDLISDVEKKYDRLVELNVQEQCVNLIKTAAVQKAIRNRGLTVHGWVFDVHTGKIIDLKIDFDKILKDIMEIYHLD